MKSPESMNQELNAAWRMLDEQTQEIERLKAALRRVASWTGGCHPGSWESKIWDIARAALEANRLEAEAAEYRQQAKDSLEALGHQTVRNAKLQQEIERLEAKLRRIDAYLHSGDLRAIRAALEAKP
jgi:DNA repair ATPase RecN